MLRKSRLMATAAFCGALLAAPLLGGPAAAEAKKPIIVGAAVAISGWMNHYDNGPLKGVRLAIADVNKAGGVLGRPLQLITADTKTKPEGSARAAQEVLEKGARLVITSCDFDFGAPAALAANAKKVPAFATCAADAKFGVQGIGRYAFSMATATPGLAALSAEWAHKKGWKNAYVMTDTIVEYTKSVCAHFKTRWKQLGGRLAGEDRFLGTDGKFPAQISRLKRSSKKADFVFLCTGGPGAAIVRQIRAAGVSNKILATDSMDGDAWMKSVPTLSGFYFGAYGSLFGDDPNPKARAFFTAFNEKFGEKPISSQAMTGYSVIEAFALAVKRAGSTDGDKLVAEYEKFRNETLLVGATTFTKDLHINLGRGQLIMQVEGGKHRAVEWYTPKQVPKPKL